MTLRSKSEAALTDDSICKKAGLDRLRLLLIFYLTSEGMDEYYIDELVKIFSETYPDQSLLSLNYLRARAKEQKRQKENYGGFGQVFTSKRLPNLRYG